MWAPVRIVSDMVEVSPDGIGEMLLEGCQWKFVNEGNDSQ